MRERIATTIEFEVSTFPNFPHLPTFPTIPILPLYSLLVPNSHFPSHTFSLSSPSPFSHFAFPSFPSPFSFPTSRYPRSRHLISFLLPTTRRQPKEDSTRIPCPPFHPTTHLLPEPAPPNTHSLLANGHQPSPNHTPDDRAANQDPQATTRKRKRR